MAKAMTSTDTIFAVIVLGNCAAQEMCIISSVRMLVVTRYVDWTQCAYRTRSHFDAISPCENQSSIHISVADCIVQPAAYKIIAFERQVGNCFEFFSPFCCPRPHTHTHTYPSRTSTIRKNYIFLEPIKIYRLLST